MAVAIAVLAATSTALPVAHARAATTAVRQDFDGDGYEDLAVAAPSATVSGRTRAGYVAVLYGSAAGLRTGDKKVYTQASPGIPGTVEKDDRFGTRLATADLDGDGFTDLLVESGGEHWQQGGIDRQGSRTVLWGGRGGFGSGRSCPPRAPARTRATSRSPATSTATGMRTCSSAAVCSSGPSAGTAFPPRPGPTRRSSTVTWPWSTRWPAMWTATASPTSSRWPAATTPTTRATTPTS
ncbi:FG-GAP repeat domain-containing protein [Streptomyces sp. NPDC058249]|uniref:FG-GAP repeat domain-containing protein n=1 Tax=Streptomyces sp. NPDC058249 TaxID=3346403 RepID=UPI0036E3DF78